MMGKRKHFWSTTPSPFQSHLSSHPAHPSHLDIHNSDWFFSTALLPKTPEHNITDVLDLLSCQYSYGPETYPLIKTHSTFEGIRINTRAVRSARLTSGYLYKSIIFVSLPHILQKKILTCKQKRKYMFTSHHHVPLSTPIPYQLSISSLTLPPHHQSLITLSLHNPNIRHLPRQRPLPLTQHPHSTLWSSNKSPNPLSPLKTFCHSHRFRDSYRRQP